MSSAMNHDLGRRFFEAQDRLRGGPDPALCASDYVARLGGNPPMTLVEHQGFASAFYAGFPDLGHRVEETIADDTCVVVRFVLQGTHQGAFMGIPPTEKRIDVGAIAILRIVAGRVAEVRGQFDQLGMMRQLGVLP
jgi:predicted ester cyclase